MFTYVLLSICALSLLLFFIPVKYKASAAIALIAMGCATTISLAFRVFYSGDQIMLPMRFDPIFGSGFLIIDALSALFMLIISVTALAVAVYAKGYMSKYENKKPAPHISLHYVCMVLMYISMIFVVLCRDAYGFLFAWEMMTISSFVLILFEAEKRKVRRTALNYLILMHIGFVFILTGFVSLSSGGLVSSLDSLPVYFSSHNPIPLFVIFLIGFGMKAGMFPFHLWLPEAHPAAPSHISAFMSGVMIKMGIYGIIRVTLAIDNGILIAGYTLLVAGIITSLWGIVFAAVQNQIKRLLAYSSIENMGIILLALGAAAIGKGTGNDFLAVCAFSGALLHIVNHSLFKTLLFFGAGNIYTQTHTVSLSQLGGLSKKMPVTAGLFLVGVMAITALPPFNGFVSEFLIYYGLIDTVASGSGGIIAAIIGIVALSLIGGIALLTFTKLFGLTFLGSPRNDSLFENAAEVEKERIIASAIPIAGIILIGLMPFIFTDGMFGISHHILGIGSVAGAADMAPPESSAYMITVAICILLIITVALYTYRGFVLKKRVVETSPVWGCGFTAQTHKMQYSGESFSEGLYGISTSLTKTKGTGDVVNKDEIFPTKHSFDVKHKDNISALFSAWWVVVIKWIHLRVMRMNTGKVNHYILYALLFLTLILVLSVLNLI